MKIKSIHQYIQKLSSKLFMAFMLVGVFSFIQAVVQVKLTHKKEKVESALLKMHSIELNVMQQTKAIKDFTSLETRNSEFYKTQQSIYLASRQRLQEEFKKSSQLISQYWFINDIDSDNHLGKLNNLSDSLDLFVDSIANLIYLRGFKDYGVEGEMREYAHILENSNCIETTKLLMLRRHEKDFIIRHEKVYVAEFNQVANLLKKQITDKDCLKNLDSYQKMFNQLVAFDQLIGINDNTALMQMMDNLLNEMIVEAIIVCEKSDFYKSELYNKLQILSITIFISIMLLTIILSIILSRIATRRITRLSDSISSYVQTDFMDIQPVATSNKKDEISELIKNYDLMRNKINSQFEHLLNHNKKQTELIDLLRQANATKDRFFSIVSHDLRGPFNVLLGYSDLLRTNAYKYSPEKIQQFANDIHTVSGKTHDLLENLLEWSRLETGMLKPNPQILVIEGLIVDTVRLLKETANQKNIGLETELRANSLITVDKNMIYTVIRNLTSNAIKYTPNYGRIRINTYEKGECIAICVSDNGVGIEKERLDKLFKIEEIHSTRGTNGEKGTGLGLLLSKELVGLNNGEMEIVSEFGQGTKIIVTFPIFTPTVQ